MQVWRVFSHDRRWHDNYNQGAYKMGLISLIETRSGVNDPNMWINTLLESSGFATKSGVAVTEIGRAHVWTPVTQ